MFVVLIWIDVPNDVQRRLDGEDAMTTNQSKHPSFGVPSSYSGPPKRKVKTADNSRY